MFKKGKNVVLAVGALAALALGGSALAQAGSNPAKHVSQPAVERVAATDTKSEAPGTEKADSALSESSSENINDGPGGHADAPGASVDHQFDGQE